MMTKKEQPAIQIALTPEQQIQIQQATGQQVRSLKLTPLEDRLSPSLTNN
jgi:hypothetical protein